jgi:chromate transport protein ChrA
VGVLFPGGWGSEPNWFALAMAAAAFVALFRFRVDPIWVVLAGGFVGLLLALMKSG